MNRTLRAALLVSLCLAGCENRDSRDSSRAAGNRLTVADDPLALVGDFIGTENYSFGSVHSAHLIRDLGFVVADWDPVGLKLYDTDGEFVRSIGTEGKGPGEFGAIHGVSITLPDTIRVVDMSNFRRSTFLWDGSLVSDDPIVLEEGWPDTLVGFLQDGAWIMAWLSYDRSSETVRPDIVSYGAFNSDGTYAGQVTQGTGTWRFEVQGLEEWEGSMRAFPVSPQPIHFTRGDSLYHSDGMESVSVRSRSGELVRQFWLPENPMPFDLAWATMDSALTESGSERNLDGVPEVNRVPRVSDILPDDRGRLWAKRYDPATDSPWLNHPLRLRGGEWLVLDLEGRLISTVLLPEGFRLEEVRGDRMIGIYADEFGVESVAVHSVPQVQ